MKYKEKRLLFINHREEEIKAFLEAMPKELQVDTADNGLDAALLMKKNTYGVIVIDMDLKGYDGEQIVKFVNKAYPNTICIIYTIALTQGQLSFLLNERNVFHIFLSPANFREDFRQTIEEGFLLYNINIENEKEEQEFEIRYEKREKGIDERNLILKRQKKEMEQFWNFSEKLSQDTLEEFGKDADNIERLRQYEQEIFQKAGEILRIECTDFEQIHQRLEREFVEEKSQREIQFYTPQDEGYDLPDTFFQSIYMVLWGFLKYFSAISKEYTVSVRVEFESSRKAVIMLVVILPAGTWETYSQKQEYEQYKKITQYVAESVMDAYVRVINDDLISYRWEVDLDNRKL